MIAKSSLLFYDEERVTDWCYRIKEELFMSKTCSYRFFVNQEKGESITITTYDRS